MSRLPQSGSDDGVWGDILNDFLSQTHNADGTLKPVPTTDITGLATVATSGSYSDLANKPFIPSTAADVGAITPAGVDTKIATQATTDSGTYVPFKTISPDHTLTTAWVDTSTTPQILKGWNGTAWVAIAASPNATLLQGSGIDPTGTTDSYTAVQAILAAAPAGSTVLVPDGATIRINGQLSLPNQITFGGMGLLNFYGLTGAGHSAAVTINADGTRVIGLRISNPSMTTPDNTSGNGNTQFGILIKANDVLISGSMVDKFQSGIVVDSHGEYERNRIVYNRVSDILGAGDGPTNTTSANGEDRGDGICNWGDQAVIIGNIVTCRTGYDARIGIHTEALPSQEGTTPAHADSMVTISGNIISGQFRRGIVTEEVSYVAISGNTVADATWWDIAVVGTARNASITGNTLYYTRTSSDNQGASWSPHHAAIMVYSSNGTVVGTTITGNTIDVASSATITSGICLTGSGAHVANFLDTIISDNNIHDQSATMATGIRFLQAATGVKVVNNTVNFFQQYGIFFSTATDISVANNRLVGPGQAVSATYGIYLYVSSSGWQVNGNTATDCDTGLYCVNGATVQVNNNYLARVNTGINGFSTDAPFVIIGNIFDSTVITPQSNVTANAVQAGNSN